jgi:hypothetical protein
MAPYRGSLAALSTNPSNGIGCAAEQPLSTAALERHALRSATSFALPLAVAGLTTLLLVRLVPDVAGAPLHEDEAVAGLISARPLGDILRTVVLDRGGAPLHFLLAHGALAVDTSPDALRWLSVLFALATVPLCYDLGRRLGGRLAGLTAAALAATSQLLGVYGTFGRMYSLFACTSVLAVDLFVRAVDRPTRRTSLAAAAAALLPLAVHPFGVFLFVSEAAVAVVLWRGRALRAALPVLCVSAFAVPLLLADLRLSDRYSPEAGTDLGGGYSAAEAALRALGGSAGGHGVAFAAFVGLAGVGALDLRRRRPPVAALAVVGLVFPPLTLALAGAAGLTSDRLGPRHLIFMLPLWIALVAVGVAVAAARIPAQLRTPAIIAVATAALLVPSAVPDPRTIATGEEEAVAAPAGWLRTHVTDGDVLYPYSPVFLAALPASAHARGLAREPVALARGARRIDETHAVYVSLPLPDGIAQGVARRLHASGVDAHPFHSWLILRSNGPFENGSSALAAVAVMLGRAAPPLAHTAGAHAYAEQLRGTACAALVLLDARC